MGAYDRESRERVSRRCLQNEDCTKDVDPGTPTGTPCCTRSEARSRSRVTAPRRTRTSLPSSFDHSLGLLLRVTVSCPRLEHCSEDWPTMETRGGRRGVSYSRCWRLRTSLAGEAGQRVSLHSRARGRHIDQLRITADPLLPLIEEYFERFATKMCCFDDLRPYLENLTSTENATLVTVMLSASTSWDELAGVSIASGVSLSTTIGTSSVD